MDNNNMTEDTNSGWHRVPAHELDALPVMGEELFRLCVLGAMTLHEARTCTPQDREAAMEYTSWMHLEPSAVFRREVTYVSRGQVRTATFSFAGDFDPVSVSSVTAALYGTDEVSFQVAWSACLLGGTAALAVAGRLKQLGLEGPIVDALVEPVGPYLVDRLLRNAGLLLEARAQLDEHCPGEWDGLFEAVMSLHT